MTRKELCEHIADKILNNLQNRKGFRHLLEDIVFNSPDIYKELYNSIVNDIEIAIIHNEN